MQRLRLRCVLTPLCALLSTREFRTGTLASAILGDRFAWKSEDWWPSGSAQFPGTLIFLTTGWLLPARFESLTETLEARRLLLCLRFDSRVSCLAAAVLRYRFSGQHGNGAALRRLGSVRLRRTRR